jgi:hypothetical protein
VLYHLSHTSTLFCSSNSGDGRLMNYLLVLTMSCDSPGLSLPSS